MLQPKTGHDCTARQVLTVIHQLALALSEELRLQDCQEEDTGRILGFYANV